MHVEGSVDHVFAQAVCQRITLVMRTQNVVLISIASVMDPSLAPAGKHCLHAYLPATEPYAIWEGLDRKRCVDCVCVCVCFHRQANSK